MPGTLTNNYGIGDTNFDNMMLTIDAQRTGYFAIGLTEYATTTIPEIAAGSKIEVNGSLFEFDSDTSISGSPSDGDTFIYLYETKGTASGATTDATGYAIGTTTITLASAGTGTIIAGDRVTFAGDTVKYVVSSGDADVSNGGTITIESPGLLTAIPASATAITVYAGNVTAEFTNTTPAWSNSKQGWYGVSTYANYRYVASMIKDGSEYRNKLIYYTGRELTTMDFQTLHEVDIDRSYAAGATYDFVFTYDWDVEAVVSLNVLASRTAGTESNFIYINDVDITDDTVTITVKNNGVNTEIITVSVVCTSSKKRV